MFSTGGGGTGGGGTGGGGTGGGGGELPWTFAICLESSTSNRAHINSDLIVGIVVANCCRS
jgi:hypothetical protein